MKDKIKKTNYICNIGLIGVGHWGKNIIKTLLKVPNIKLTCVASKNKNTKNLVQTNCKIFSDWKDLISSSKLDGIIICTPPETHFKIAQEAIKAGHSLLIEKPLTLDYSEAKKIHTLAESHNTLVMTDLTQLFNHKFLMLKKSLKLVGDINFLITKTGNFGPYRKDTPVLWDWGAHDLSTLISLMGKSPTKISSKKIKEDNSSSLEQSIWQINCLFDNQIEAVSLIGNMMPRCRKIGVLGSKGMIVFDDIDNIPLKFYSDWKIKVFPTHEGQSIKISPSKQPLHQVLDSFSKFIMEGAKSHWSLSLGVEISRLLSECSTNK